MLGNTRRNTNTPRQSSVQTTRTTSVGDRTPVYSYHAKSSPQADAAYEQRGRDRSRLDVDGARTKTRQATAVSAGRHRFFAIIGALLLLVIVGWNSVLSEPQVALAGKPEERVLLSAPTTYQEFVDSQTDGLHFKIKAGFKSDALRRSLLDKFPELADVTVTVPLVGRSPVLTLYAAQPIALYTGLGSTTYVLDTTGRTVSTNTGLVSGRDGLFQVIDNSGLKLTLGSQALAGSDMAFISEIQRQFAAKGDVIETITLPTAAAQLQVKLQGKQYFIKFTFKADARQQAGSYLAAAKRFAEQGNAPKEYIDVRVAEKVYFK